MNRLLFALALLLLLASCTDCLIGGRPAEQFQPIAIGFTTTCQNVVCGGTVIAPRWVLTAKHCLCDAGVKHGSRAAIGNAANGTPLCGTLYSVDSVFWNPSADIALVSLTQPVTGATPLPFGNVATGNVVTMVGRGADLSNYATLSLQAVEVIVQSDCQTFPNGVMCAAPSCGQHYAGRGDSGGPVLLPNGDGWMQVGVITDVKKNRSGFTPVAPYEEWIRETMQRGSGAAECK